MDQGQDAELLLTALRALRFDHPNRVAVAVSGGGDSMALLHLLHRAAHHLGTTIAAATVDHRLRPGSADEAAAVARFCAALGVPHVTLPWDHGALSGNLMDHARRARYALMRDWAQASGIADVALGHTADDQAETFLMGLARASGLDGLTGMRAFWRDGDVRFVRPMLGHCRADLRAYLRRQGIAWADDPTNDDDRYTRIRARRVVATLAPLGITVQSITTSVARLTMAQDALRDTLYAAVSAHVTEAGGGLQISRTGFDAMPSDIQRRLLQAAIAWLSGGAHPPRSEKQLTLLAATQSARDATLGGCRIRHRGGVIHVTREAKAVADIASAPGQLWDARWQLDGPARAGLQVRALGAAGLPACRDWRTTGLSRDVLLVSPAIWHGDTLISAPLTGMANGWKARIVAGFGTFVLSH